MNRLGMKGPLCEKWINYFCPSCNVIFYINKEIEIWCEVLLNGETGYEIEEGDDTHTVCLEKNTCKCSAWDISGIPFQHAICVLVHNKQEPMDHISNFYHIDMYRVAYQFKIMPLRGKKF